MTWVGANDEGKNDECIYNSSGKIPLLCAAGAFFALAIAMVVEHAFILFSFSSSSLLLLNMNPDSDFAKNFAWQAGFFYISTWLVNSSILILYRERERECCFLQ